MMEVYSVPLETSGAAQKFLIYRPLAGLAFVGNRSMADLALRAASSGWSADQEAPSQQKALAFLQRIGYFQPDPTVTHRPAQGYNTLVLLLTNRCHLRCVYCYAAAGERPPEVLSLEDARAAMDYFFEQAAAQGLKEVFLNFHGGGEPTFAWPEIQAMTRAARAYPLPCNISLTSNAIWSPAQLDWIVANIDQISISMDGRPETQDAQRPLVSGKPSSAIVMRNLAELDRRGVPYGIRMTAAYPFDSLPEDIAYLCAATACRTFQAEPAFNHVRGGHETPAEEQWPLFAEAFSEALDIADERGRRLYYSGARPGTASPVFCSSPYDALVIAPGGRIVACYEITDESHPLAPIASFGRITGQQVQVDQAARERLHSLLAERRESCRDCFCYWTCAGDCFTRAFAPGEQGHLVKSHRCQMNRTITAQMLLNRIAAGDGYWSAQEEASAAAADAVKREEELHG
jgi:uncharacterized protein